MTHPTPKPDSSGDMASRASRAAMGPAAHLAPEAEPAGAAETLFAIRNQLEAAKASLMFNNRWTNEAGYITDAALWIERSISAADDVLSAAPAGPESPSVSQDAPSPLPSPTPEGLVEDGRPIGDTPWRRFRDQKPTYDGWGERHFLTRNTRVASYDVGCIDGQWSVGEAIDGHPDDLWRWLDSNPEHDDAASRIEALEGERDNWASRAAERDRECEIRARKQWDAEAALSASQAVVGEMRKGLEDAIKRLRDMHCETCAIGGLAGISIYPGPETLADDLDHLLSLHPEGGSSACADLGCDGPRAASESPSQSEGGEA